jgi:hypothetical protein
MGDLYSGPHILLILLIIVGIPVICYIMGFRNGKREGERIQLQKQVDSGKTKAV